MSKSAIFAFLVVCALAVYAADTTAPTLVVPPDYHAECKGFTHPLVAGVATATDDEDPSPSISFSDFSHTHCAGLITKRKWIAIDASGNQAVGYQSVTTSDTTPPVLTVPGSTTFECTQGQSVDPDTTGYATAVDNCDDSPVVTYEDEAIPGSCGTSVKRTWTATDACGNSVSQVQTITVVDTVKPHITVPASVTLSCSSSGAPAIAGTATATDACDSAPVVTYSDSVAPSCGASSTARVITRTWTATDSCGNSQSGTQTITLDDATAPLLIAPADITIECTEDPRSLDATGGSATAQDDCDSAPAVTYQETFVTSCGSGGRPAGVLTRVWQAADACGNTATATQKVTVVDTQAPVWTFSPPSTTVGCGVSLDNHAELPLAQASDACSAVTVTHTDTVTQTADCASTKIRTVVVRTFTATDACHNVNTYTQTISMRDNIPPTANTVSDHTLELGNEDVSVAALGKVEPTGDNCDPEPTTSMSESKTYTCGSAYILTRHWTTSDSCGNTVSQSQFITVQDTTAPAWDYFPPDITIDFQLGSSPQKTGGYPTATDANSPEPSITYTQTAVNGDPTSTIVQVITRTWAATDPCNNQITRDQIITVTNTHPPEVDIDDRCYEKKDDRYVCFDDVTTTNSFIKAVSVPPGGPVYRRFTGCSNDQGSNTEKIKGQWRPNCGMTTNGKLCVFLGNDKKDTCRVYTITFNVYDERGNMAQVSQELKIRCEDRRCKRKKWDDSVENGYETKWWNNDWWDDDLDRCVSLSYQDTVYPFPYNWWTGEGEWPYSLDEQVTMQSVPVSEPVDVAADESEVVEKPAVTRRVKVERPRLFEEAEPEEVQFVQEEQEEEEQQVDAEATTGKWRFW